MIGSVRIRRMQGGGGEVAVIDNQYFSLLLGHTHWHPLGLSDAVKKIMLFISHAVGVGA